MRRKLLSTAVFGSALLLAVTGCSTPAETDTTADGGLTGTGTGADCVIESAVPISAAFSLTGAGAQYGASQKNALELAVENLNAVGGVTYDLTVEDDATDPKQAIQVFDTFVNSGASIIIGPTLSNTAKQTNPIAQDAQVPVLGVSNTAAGITEIGDYIFRDSLTEDAVIPQTVKAAVDKLGVKKVVVMYSNDDAFTESGYQAFSAALTDQNVEVADTLTFSKSDTDFRALLNKAKQSDADAIVVSGLIDAAVPLVSQAREIGIDTPIIGGNGFNSPALLTGAGKAAEGVIVGAAWNSASDNAQNVKFIEDYTATYSSAPDQFSAQAYAGMQIIDHAVRSECSAEREDIKSALGDITDVPTVLGDVSLNENRDAVHDALVQIVQDGQFTILK
ncbi:ABC transporter substrate-binding protein [Cryobacterium psychrophilum]|uniref:ABC transporter substrate-binding protein n=1 Tax=Cryobacterium psychrophilum TaxID=41988 RepID=A0A4Y8KS06_9MICO|nr:ABC transporter substrate-binding protein [Cryobacterium psychrophilum]TDW28739.1 amino acid/amide ABC transporter substrate-binding protein (HAAT family) [Cryobacterium psychrophilum]TFD82394.1 ABC transporter substrate-binding protein [Cryobacterium psychrophilum]